MMVFLISERRTITLSYFAKYDEHSQSIQVYKNAYRKTAQVEIYIAQLYSVRSKKIEIKIKIRIK